MADTSGLSPYGVYMLGILNTAQALEVGATGLIVYEYCITFSDEVRYIWRRQFTCGTVIFLVNRYVTLLYRVLRMIQLIQWSNLAEDEADEICAVTWTAIEVCNIIIYVSVAFFSALRLYAIWGKNKIVFFITLCLGLTYPGLNSFYTSKTYHYATGLPPFRGCSEDSTFENHNIDSTFFLLGIAFVLFFETTVMVLTLVKTVGYQHVLWSNYIRKSLITLIMRDGTLYYIAMLTMNSSALLSIVVQGFDNLPTLTDTVMSICLCRFILHLRENDVSAGFPGTPKSTASGLSKFTEGLWMNRLLGNIGTSIRWEKRGPHEPYEHNTRLSSISRGVDDWTGPPLHQHPLLAGLVAETGLNTRPIEDKNDSVGEPRFGRTSIV